MIDSDTADPPILGLARSDSDHRGSDVTREDDVTRVPKRDLVSCLAVLMQSDRLKVVPSLNEDERYRKWGGQSRPVSRKTVLLMLKPHLLEEALTGRYSFCAARDCRIVYFEDHGTRVFTSDDLRVIVGAKASTDPIPLCYCFGFNESHLREQIAQTRRTALPDRISSLIREGLCACEARNPSGVCCLGEVNRTAKRLRQELSVK